MGGKKSSLVNATKKSILNTLSKLHIYNNSTSTQYIFNLEFGQACSQNSGGLLGMYLFLCTNFREVYKTFADILRSRANKPRPGVLYIAHMYFFIVSIKSNQRCSNMVFAPSSYIIYIITIPYLSKWHSYGTHIGDGVLKMDLSLEFTDQVI